MRCFLVEIPMPEPGGTEAARAARMLRAAESRVGATSTPPRSLLVGTVEDGRCLIWLLEAPAMEAVRDIVELAVLPGAGIREVSPLDPGLPVSAATRPRRRSSPSS